MQPDRKHASVRLLIISHDVVGKRMAGPGIRYWEMARVLAAQQPVTLIAPQPIDQHAPALTCGAYAWGDMASIAAWLHATDVVLTNGFVLQDHPDLAHIAQPLAIDLYDPILLENLELFRTAPMEQRTHRCEHDRLLLARQLEAGDFFLCATERQRDLYMGALISAGRMTPTHLDTDPQLRTLIDVVPFGLPARPPVKQRPALRSVVPGIGTDDVVLLWSGGLWDWLDPLTLIQAMPRVVAHHPHTRLVFLAGQHPGNVHPMRKPQEARDLAQALGLLDRHIFFYEQWIPYEERADFLLEADIAIWLHHHSLESAYAAVRSRFLEHLWTGLPSIVSAGDAAAQLVETEHLGYVIMPGALDETADAVIHLVGDQQQRARFARNASRLAQHYTWERVVAPLIRFCHAPQKRRSATATSVPATRPDAGVERSAGESETMQQDQQSLVQQLETLWQFGAQPPQGGLISKMAQRVLLRLMGPLFAQQRDFNATTVKLLYSVLEQNETATTRLQAVIAQIVALQRDTHARIDTISEWSETIRRDINARLDLLADFQGKLSEHLDALDHDLHARLDTLAAFDSEINDRVTRLTYTVQLLDDAVATTDEATAMLATHLAALKSHLNQSNGSSSGNGTNGGGDEHV